MSHVDYLHTLIPSKFNETLSLLENLIRENFPTCNAVCGTGLSGTMVVPALAAKMGVEWFIVRKGEQNHSYFTVEASAIHGQMNIVFVDDLVETGTTFGQCVEKVFKRTDIMKDVNARFLGGVTYHNWNAKRHTVHDNNGKEYFFYSSRKF